MSTALRKAIAPAFGPRQSWEREEPMAGMLDYRWHLRQVVASRAMFATTGLQLPRLRAATQNAHGPVHDLSPAAGTP